MKSAKEFWKEKFQEYPQNDAEKLSVAMMASYAEDIKSVKEMRKVKFKKWVPLAYTEDTKIRIAETGKWEDDYSNNGVFHQWGAAYEEFESGAGNYTAAIVEMSDGTIVEVLPSNLKFVV